jgi:hypothetical protein
MRNPELPDVLTLTHPPEARAHPRAPLPLEQDPRQGSLFVLQRTLPPRKLVPSLPQNPHLTALEAASVPSQRQEAIQVTITPQSSNVGPPSASHCPECGDSVPPKAKACPNCYTTSQHYNAEDMARAIWAETLAKSEGR